MSAVIKSGTGVTVGEVDIDWHTYCLKIRASVAAVVTLNGKDVALAVTPEYQDFYIDVTTFTVVSGTVDYVAIG